MFKQIFLPILATIAFIVFVGVLTQRSQNSVFNLILSPSPSSSPALSEIVVGTSSVKVEIAKTRQERENGLSSRTFLPEDSGMLFVFDKNVSPVFWMKDTLIALDLIWIKNGAIVKIIKNVQPEPDKPDSQLTRYYSEGPVDYVLEVNAGFSDKNKVKVGDPVEIP